MKNIWYQHQKILIFVLTAVVNVIYTVGLTSTKIISGLVCSEAATLLSELDRQKYTSDTQYKDDLLWLKFRNMFV
jgi:lipase chaperone LimK